MGSDTGALTRTGSSLPAAASGHIPPPQNQEAEQFLLASLIDVGGNVAEAMAFVSVDDFQQRRFTDNGIGLPPYDLTINFRRLNNPGSACHADFFVGRGHVIHRCRQPCVLQSLGGGQHAGQRTSHVA